MDGLREVQVPTVAIAAVVSELRDHLRQFDIDSQNPTHASVVEALQSLEAGQLDAAERIVRRWFLVSWRYLDGGIPYDEGCIKAASQPVDVILEWFRDDGPRCNLALFWRYWVLLEALGDDPSTMVPG